jgi:hypothetical protein
MGADAGFDMVPRLSKDTVDSRNWAAFIAVVKEQYEGDDKVQIKPHYIEFAAGEHPLLPFEGHKFLRFSSKITGRIADETGVEDYLDTVTRVARLVFGTRVRRWNELSDSYGFYGWREIHDSIRSYDQVCLPLRLRSLASSEPLLTMSQPESSGQATSSTSMDGNNSSANLDCPYFEVIEVPGKGKGLVALVDIAKGTRILCEKPLLTARNNSPAMLHQDLVPKIKALSKDQQRQFLSLHNNFPGKYAFSGIVKTNALPCGCGSDIGGIYPTICLINHSCMPNAHNNWNEEKEHETIHATRIIQAGEEITISYINGGPTTFRRADLESSFGFKCSCKTCFQPLYNLTASDGRRLQIQRLDDQIGDPIKMFRNPAASLADCHLMLQVLDEEYGRGLAGALLARLYYDAFQVCIAHGDQARALVFAERAYEARVVCEGEDSPLTQKMKSLTRNPAGHLSFGVASKKWKTSKSQVPKGLNANGFENWLWRVGQ